MNEEAPGVHAPPPAPSPLLPIPSPPPAAARRRPLREMQVLLPVALLLLVALGTFTLFSYRSAVRGLTEERREEAADLAAALAQRRAASPGQTGGLAAGLRELAPRARGAALLDAHGTPLEVVGDLPAGTLLPPPASLHGPPEHPFGVGPDVTLPDAVAGFAAIAREGALGWVRVDLPAVALGGQWRSLGLLSVLVLTVNSALVLLMLLSLRRLLTPYESLLARAQQLAPPGQEEESDEVAFLLTTFERALEALAERGRGRAEDELAALQRTLGASLESGLLLLDRDGGVLALNPVGASLLEVEPPPPGTPLAELLAGQADLRTLLADAVARQRPVHREERDVSTAAGARTLGLTVHPLRRDDGEVRGFLILFADLTLARRQAEESRLAESLGSLGELAGGVAHELRNGLATLRGYLTLIERRPDEDSAGGFLSEMRREADHLQRVTEDFLSFARPGTARLEDFSLAEVVIRAAADPALGGVAVTVVSAPAAARLHGDPQLVLRAVRNLLHNAAEAEREAGRRGPVEVAIQLRDEEIELAIDDRGGGLPAGLRERLFHPFATGRPGGVGLGLALAQRIVVLHGGRIQLEDRPGGGTRARIWFRRDTSVTEHPTPSAPELGSGPALES